MPRSRAQTYIGFCGETPVAGAFIPTEGSRELAERALRSVMAHDQARGDESDIVETPSASWMAVTVDPTLTPQQMIDTLADHGSVKYVGDVNRSDMARFVGQQATEQLLGRRPGVL